MADSEAKKMVTLVPRHGFDSVESEKKSLPVIKKSGTKVAAKNADKVMEQYAKEGYALRKLED